MTPLATTAAPCGPCHVARVRIGWCGRTASVISLLALGVLVSLAGIASAQDLLSPVPQVAAPSAADSGVPPGASGGMGGGMGGMTVVPRSQPEASKVAPPAPVLPQTVPVKLEALLTADGQRIDQGLVWRVFATGKDAARDAAAAKDVAKDARSKLIGTWREASPQLQLAPGDYVVNAAYGRAHLTRPLSVKAGGAVSERFVLNAGGLLLKAMIGNTSAAASAVSYNILSDDRDQFGNRAVVMAGAKPGLIIRLNAGIYQLVSTYGDANATVRADVTVEAGKLTEATVAHTAARVTLKLVQRQGGEALADTLWSIQTAQGEVVKESVGALPTHTLAPGTYVAVAKSLGRTYRRDFVLQNGDSVQVEVLSE